jgi:hypothetical protein
MSSITGDRQLEPSMLRTPSAAVKEEDSTFKNGANIMPFFVTTVIPRNNKTI